MTKHWLREIEEKWQEVWEKEKVYEAEPNEKEKKFITAAFPYPNSPQHIGHGRTYTITDVYARYLRMKGYNVLFPMGFHVTGTPIIAMAKKLREKDRGLLEIFEKIYHIPKEKLKELEEPEKLVMYFSEEIEKGMKEMGYSIDWRRKFYSFDKEFNKFIEWQFRKLEEMGYLKRGSHPVAWCPSDDNAVSAHDTKGDKDPEIEETVGILFEFEDGYFIASTYRPETLFGITNLWVNPEVVYVKVKVNDRIYYLSKDAYELLKNQFNGKIIEEIEGKEFIGKKVRTPFGKTVPILQAKFVKPEEGTGVVMSVPMHAPYDYLAIRDLNIDIEMPKIIEVENYGTAKDIVEKMKIKDQMDIKAEEATKEIYKKELLKGRMRVDDEEFNGLSVKEAREKIKKKLREMKKAVLIYTIANGPIECRCGSRIVVKIVEDQWFIDYSKKEWKEKTKECLSKMRIVPEHLRKDFLYVIDWLKEKACTRKQGLGTRFPFQRDQIIESLSDSTIYMAFYTIAHMIKGKEVDDKFFDRVFLGKGSGWEKERESFEYWYPLDSRHSGADLVRNHLTFFLFNHTAIFPRELWPKQIVVNGFVLMDGKKMSKSLGNILPLREAIKKYGADVIRASIIGGAELEADTDFTDAVARGMESRLKFFVELAKKSSENKGKMDKWILSKLHKRLKTLEKHYENFEYRTIVKELIYEMFNDIQWYLKRSKEVGLREFFQQWSRAIAPIIPHTAEEIWHLIGNESLVVKEELPTAEEALIDEKIEMEEELLRRTIDDAHNIIKLTGIKPKKVKIVVADEWRVKAYLIAKEEKKVDSAIKRAIQEINMPEKNKEIASFIQYLAKNIHSLEDILSEKEEREALDKNKKFLEKEIGCEVSVVSEREEKVNKRILPMKPALILE